MLPGSVPFLFLTSQLKQHVLASVVLNLHVHVAFSLWVTYGLPSAQDWQHSPPSLVDFAKQVAGENRVITASHITRSSCMENMRLWCGVRTTSSTPNLATAADTVHANRTHELCHVNK